MREACLYNNWSFVPIFLKIYRALMRWTPWSFFGEVAVMSRHDGGTHLEWGVEGRGMRVLSQILSDESLSYSLKHISTGEHSLHISWRSTHLLHLYFLFSWWRHQMETCSASLAFCAGNSPATAGNSLVTGEFSHRPMTRSFDVFFDLRLKRQLSKQSRRRWFETPSCSLWRHCNVVPNSDPVIRAAMGSFGVQCVTLVQFWIGEKGQLRGSVHYGKNGLKFGTLLYPDYHSLKLTIFCTQWQLKFVVSDHP